MTANLVYMLIAHYCTWCKANRSVEEKHKLINCEFKTDQQLKSILQPDNVESSWSQLPFHTCRLVPDFVLIKPEVSKPDVLPQCKVNVTPTFLWFLRSLTEGHK